MALLVPVCLLLELFVCQVLLWTLAKPEILLNHYKNCISHVPYLDVFMLALFKNHCDSAEVMMCEAHT